eukprot:3467689-Alexandrium_andersonii.AAC.1
MARAGSRALSHPSCAPSSGEVASSRCRTHCLTSKAGCPAGGGADAAGVGGLSLIHISEPTRLALI